MYRSLREFIQALEKKALLKRIPLEINPKLEITQICDRALKQEGPALLFERPTGYQIPVLGNLFGTLERITLGMGQNNQANTLSDIGKLLAFLKSPPPPEGFKDALSQIPIYKQALNMAPKVQNKAPCQQIVWEGKAVDLSKLPIQTCWPEDAGPLITWGLVITRGPNQTRQNLGIYRQQVIDNNKLIMRWLPHRGGAQDYRDWCKKHPSDPFPVAVAIGADPATILAAVAPIPDNLSEYAFAGLLRGHKTEVVKALNSELQVPAQAEIILEGVIYPNETAQEGPFGDHTGYYNEVETFNVFTVEKITLRDNPIYHSTYTGRPPDEPAMLGMAFNEVFLPILQQQFPEIVDFYLPPEGCSYRMAIVSIKKQYAGHAKQVMMGIWSFLKQFLYTKFIVVVDDDINIRNWQDVIWAITTRLDPVRDTLMIENTPIDYLDFASPTKGLGSKMGLDATHKTPGETTRAWGKVIQKDKNVVDKIDALWADLGI